MSNQQARDPISGLLDLIQSTRSKLEPGAATAAFNEVCLLAGRLGHLSGGYMFDRPSMEVLNDLRVVTALDANGETIGEFMTEGHFWDEFTHARKYHNHPRPFKFNGKVGQEQIQLIQNFRDEVMKRLREDATQSIAGVFSLLEPMFKEGVEEATIEETFQQAFKDILERNADPG